MTMWTWPGWQPGEPVQPPSPALQRALEEILQAVQLAEENWRFDDRLDMSLETARRRLRPARSE